jgi:hypothetical protein
MSASCTGCPSLGSEHMGLPRQSHRSSLGAGSILLAYRYCCLARLLVPVRRDRESLLVATGQQPLRAVPSRQASNASVGFGSKGVQGWRGIERSNTMQTVTSERSLKQTQLETRIQSQNTRTVNGGAEPKNRTQCVLCGSTHGVLVETSLT